MKLLLLFLLFIYCNNPISPTPETPFTLTINFTELNRSYFPTVWIKTGTQQIPTPYRIFDKQYSGPIIITTDSSFVSLKSTYVLNNIKIYTSDTIFLTKDTVWNLN